MQKPFTIRPVHKILFVVVAFTLLGLLWFAVVHAFHQYQVHLYGKSLDNRTDEMQQRAASDRERALRDDAGGTTPQETISLYIAALRAGEYERASTYFVSDKQSAILDRLRAMSPEVLRVAISVSEEASTKEGELSSDDQTYIIHDPILFHLIRYPNGVWKIVEW